MSDYLADFYDYYFEAGICRLSSSENSVLVKSQLVEIIDCWRDYQVYGSDSGNEFVRAISIALPSPRVTQRTANNKLAALGRFLIMSERIRRDSLNLSRLNIRKADVDVTPLLNDFGNHVVFTAAIRSAMVKNSMLSAVLANGQENRLPSVFASEKIVPFDQRCVFPLESFQKFVDALPSHRDKALYALYAASGCRASEGLQVLWDDIDIDAGTVQLVNPDSRANNPSYLALALGDREKLVWKGRHTQDTLLIEPFASMFFEYLEIYHREEYYPHGQHRFVFQILRSPGKGRPYFATDSKTRQEVFNTAASKSRLPEYVRGPHSLRHAYGRYLRNYIPISENKYGMPLGYVRIAMGHVSIKSTEKYALVDEDLLNLQIENANSNVYENGVARSVRFLKLNAVQAQIEKLKKIERALAE